jgi:hypothetical protein
MSHPNLSKLVKLGPGRYRCGNVHFEHVSVTTEPCVACGGTQRDPANRRRKCRKCSLTKGTTGKLSPAANIAIREGYSFGRLGNGRSLEGLLTRSLFNPLDDITIPAHYVYYVDEEMGSDF